MQLEMDRENKISDLTEICMVNPFKTSVDEVTENISGFNFFTPVYADQIIEESGDFTLPKCIFLPSESVMKTFIKANISFANTDTLEQFLARFAILNNKNHYLQQKEGFEM